MSKIFYKDYTIELLYKPKLKNSYISISPDKSILIKTSSKSQEFIENLLKEREGWIEKQLKKLDSLVVHRVNLEDEILLFDTIYSIDTPEADFLRKKLLRLKESSHEKVMQCYDAFYRYSAEAYIAQRVVYFSNLMALKYTKIKYRKMRSRWGSCSSAGVLTFNTELMKVKKELIDYVVVHELAHLVHMNHSQAFHQLVANYVEDSYEKRKALKQVRLLH